MSRVSEAVLLVAAAAVAGFGVTLVNLAQGAGVDAQVGLTFLVFLLAFGAVHLGLRAFAPRAVPYLLPPAALLAALSFVEIYRISPFRAGLQRWWLLIGAAGAVVTLALLRRAGVALLRRYRFLLFSLTLLLLAAPLIPTGIPGPLHGLEANGSRLWVVANLGFIDLHFQPGEIAKVAFVAFLAAYLADRPSLAGTRRRLGPWQVPEPRQLFPLVAMWALSSLVLVYQRDLGAATLLFAVVVGMLYATTADRLYLWMGAFLAGGGAVAAYTLFAHVQRRVEAWLNPFADFEGAGYQLAQGVFALGSGSLAGAGPGLGRPDLIPNAITDFIFASVGEELGFAGSVAVLAAYAVLIAVGFGVALRARDRFRKLLAAGLTFAFGFQTFLILAGVLRILPLTGITLPFMSYGGSSLVGNFVLVALLARVSHEEAT